MDQLKCPRCGETFYVKDVWDYPTDRETETDCPNCEESVKFVKHVEHVVTLKQKETR